MKALVVLSGGQDSMTCLGVALRVCKQVEAISFDYGQRHKVELEHAEELCRDLNIPWIKIKIDFLKDLVTSALLETESDVGANHQYKPGLPASFVPNRNALFLTIAHAYAQEINAEVIYAGMCQTDYSGYPDCRAIFIQAFQKALNVGYETGIIIETPLMDLTKAQTFALAEEVGFLDIVLTRSVTCYNGAVNKWQEWGFGCGECPACLLRAKGWNEFQQLKKERENAHN
jgi:7-cyano-7-deazaguanine synthase